MSYRVVVFKEGLVNVIKSYVKKGSKLYIEGQLQTRKWVDSSGNEKYSTEIVLQGFNTALILLDNKNVSANPYPNDNGHVPNFDNTELDNEIPF